VMVKLKIPTTKTESYETLELSEGASEQEINSAFRFLSLKWYPQRNNSSEAENNFEAITKARDILTGENKKPCRSCEEIHNGEIGTPPSCEKIEMAISELENLSHYIFFTPSEKQKFLRNLKEGRYYYEGEELCKTDQKGFIIGGFLGNILQKAKILNNEKQNSIDRERNECLQKLKKLDD
ncbi:4853_t:CDS:2, partial [Funneliformis geosporum]